MTGSRWLAAMTLVPILSPAWAASAPRTIHVPGDQPTIQAGIDAAQNGDTVVVADGTYSGPGNHDIELRGKAITVRSANGPANCIIDCGGSASDPHRGFYIHDREESDTVMSGFTIAKGVVNDDAPGGGRGGGIFCERSSPTVEDCVLVGNIAVTGGGLFCQYGEPIVIRCIFKRNQAEGAGGGFGNWNASIFMTDCIFRGNHTEGSGGAGYSSGGELIVERCGFHDNKALESGGALLMRGGAPVIRLSTFEGNKADYFGGAISAGTLFLSDSRFSSNEAEARGGALFMQSSASPVVTRCQFVGNAAGVGGGISIGGVGVSVRNCLVRGNMARGGGGVDNWNSTIVNCAIIDNTAEWGGGMSNGNGVTVNCTIAGNTAELGGGVYRVNNVDFALYHNSIIWGNTPDLFGGFTTRTVTFSDVEGGYEGIGNFDLDPRFVDPSMGNYRLSRWSLCIDAADPSTEDDGTPDLDGHARRLCRRVDMGAYESGIGDHNCDRRVDRVDLTAWTSCATGPRAGMAPARCTAFDFNLDGDVDLEDFAGFMAVFARP